MEAISDFYELRNESASLENYLERVSNNINDYFSLVNCVRHMSTRDNCATESFYNGVLLSLEADDENNKEKEGDGDKEAGAFKKIWITIKTFFKKVFGFVANLIQKVKVAIVKSQHKKWTKRVKGALLGWATSYEECFKKLDDKMDYFIGVLFAGMLTSTSKGVIPWSNVFDNLLKSLTESLSKIRLTIDSEEGNKFSDSDGDKDRFKSTILVMKNINKMLRTKSTNDIKETIKSFREAYNKIKDNDKGEGPQKEIMESLLNTYGSINKGIDKLKLNLENGKLRDFHHALMKEYGDLDCLMFKQTAEDILGFLRKVDGFRNKIFSLIGEAEKKGRNGVVKFLQNFMLLYQTTTTLALNLLSAQTNLRKFVLKTSDKDKKDNKKEKKNKKKDKKG